jgi:hypothetical protein
MEMEFRTSASLTRIGKALSEFQGVCPTVPFDQRVEYFNNRTQKQESFQFCSLPQLITFTRPHLAACNLVVLQPVVEGGCMTILLHTESGEFIQGFGRHTLPDKVKADIQMQVGETTTLRRKCYAAMLGIVADADDPANEMTPTQNPNNTKEASDEIVNKALEVAQKKGKVVTPKKRMVSVAEKREEENIS